VTLPTSTQMPARPPGTVTLRHTWGICLRTPTTPESLFRECHAIEFEFLDCHSFLKNQITMRIFATPFHRNRPQTIDYT